MGGGDTGYGGVVSEYTIKSKTHRGEKKYILLRDGWHVNEIYFDNRKQAENYLERLKSLGWVK